MKKFFAVLATLLVVTAAVLFIWHFTDHFNEDFKTFYIVYDGESIMGSEAEVKVEEDTEETFKVKYPFETKKRDYTVAITPNPEVDLEYTVGTAIKRWSGEKGVESLFEIQKSESSFTLKTLFSADNTIEEILSMLYPDEEINLLSDPPDPEVPLYILTVTSYNEAIKYSIQIRVTPHQLTGLELSQDRIYF